MSKMGCRGVGNRTEQPHSQRQPARQKQDHDNDVVLLDTRCRRADAVGGGQLEWQNRAHEDTLPAHRLSIHAESPKKVLKSAQRVTSTVSWKTTIGGDVA
jgi:hypothetical protein